MQIKIPDLTLVSLLILAIFHSGGLIAQTQNEQLRQLEADVRFLASDALEGRATGRSGEKAAAEYIATRMWALGLEPAGENGTFYQDFTVRTDNPHDTEFVDEPSQTSVTGRNVIGYIDNDAENTVVIGAHYDHLGYGEFFGSLHAGEPEIHNGADDNASGVAVLLQLAEICMDTFDHANFLFIAFSGEERGLWGSNYFVKHPTIPIEEMNYMLNFDMVGRLQTERKISINGVGTAPEWMPALESIKAGSLELVTTESGIGASDHTSFYFEKVPAIHFFTGQHNDYHKPSDDIELVNFPGMADVTDFVVALIAELADKGKLTFQETKNPNEPSARDFKVTLGVMPDYLYTDGGMRIDGVRSDRPADKAGLKKGDIVLRMGDVEVNDMEGYMQALGEFEPGQTIEIEFRRGEEIMTKELTFD